MKLWKQIKLVQTSGAFPEQYDAYLNGVEVGYLRLRHGFFVVECLDEIVYTSKTIGDGFFHNVESNRQLKNAKKAIAKALPKDPTALYMIAETITTKTLDSKCLQNENNDLPKVKPPMKLVQPLLKDSEYEWELWTTTGPQHET